MTLTPEQIDGMAREIGDMALVDAGKAYAWIRRIRKLKGET